MDQVQIPTTLLVKQTEIEKALQQTAENIIGFAEQKIIEVSHPRTDWILEAEAVKILGFKTALQVRKLAEKGKIIRSIPEGTKKSYYSLKSINRYIETGLA